MNTAEFTWKTGDYVVYKKHGVYEISEIKTVKTAGVSNLYYVLKSVYDDNASVYVPADKEDLVSRMENILSKEDIEDIVKASRNEKAEWIESNFERFSVCEEIIAQGNLSRIIALMRLLSEKKEESIAAKKRVFAHDERMLSACQKIVSEAFAFTLGIDKKDVTGYISEML